MKTSINRFEFAAWFAEHRPNNFSPIGRLELFEMLTSYEENTDEEIEFDPIAFCCEYTEYKDMDEFWKEYDKEDYPDEEAIMDATFYWAFENGDSFIIQTF
tara:strand:- start:127 stop:429 length:303 start_codon:yes stop_codon:yes gene_type:complete